MTKQIIQGILAWIQKNWIVSTLATIAIWLLINGMVSCVDERNYKRDIRANNKEISELKRDMKAEGKKAEDALARALTAEADARKERAEKDQHKANAARIEKEKRGLQERIAALPPTQIVIQTIYILEVAPEEVTFEPRGVLFTLVAARRNLEILEGFSLQKKQIGELQLSLAKSEKADEDTQEANTELKKAVASQKIQIDKWPAIELEWKENFDLSEQRGKKARAKGRKEGGIVGAAAVFILWIALGK